MARRNEEDLLNPDRVFYRMVSDYADGQLSKPWLKLYRARVTKISTVRGDLEMNPPNPPNSVQARIYSSGLDANIPSNALTVFHPLLPGHLSPSLTIGEHVYVVFEDEQMTQGLWISTVASHVNLNNSDPDRRPMSQRNDPSTAIEGSPSQTGERVVPGDSYAAPSTNFQGRQSIVENHESTTSQNPWRGKRVVLIGDSMVGQNGLATRYRTPLARGLDTALQSKGVASFRNIGRAGWSITQWNAGTGGRFPGEIPRSTRNSSKAASITEIVERGRYDIVLVSLGGNDAGRGESSSLGNASTVERAAQELWEEIQSLNLDFALWCGPPSVIEGTSFSGQALQNFNSRRNEVNAIVKRTVLDRFFIDCRSLTSRSDMQQNRRSDGVHWSNPAPVGDQWARLFLDKGSQL